MGRLDRKVAVITGAASGIGRATAIRFAGEGAAVVIADLNREGGDSAVRDCKENGGNAVFQRADVTQEGEIQAAVARAVKEFGRLDIIYNNAGLGGAVGPIEKITVENWDRSMAVLLRAVFLGIKHAVPEMRKAGVINLTRSASLELAKDKIRVNCICPGGINTPLIYRHVPGGEGISAQFLAHFQPLQRAGRPEDIAAMALFLAGDDSEWITGQEMVVDGGLTAGWGPQPAGGGGGAQDALGPQDGWSGPSFEIPERK